MEEQNRKYIALIAFLRNFISIFFSLFFNIYILKIVNNDFNFIIKYSVIGVIADFVLCYLILKFISSKNAKKIYMASFPLLILVILLLLIFKENIVNYIFLFKILERLAAVCYSLPYELVIIGSNTSKTMNNYMANINILTSLSTILTPIFSGFVIENFSYYMLFILLSIEGLIIVMVSSNIENFTVNDKKLELKKFFSMIKGKKLINDMYKCMFFRRISSKGAITELLPVVLFLKLGTELDFGAYNSLFAMMSVLSLQVLKIINTTQKKKIFYPILAVLIFISSIFVVYSSSFTTLIIYYILMNTFGIIIESESCSILYLSIKIDNLSEYKKEHILAYNLYMFIGQLISYSLVYILYNYFYNINILSVSICVLMFFLIISSIYLNKASTYIKNYNS